MDRSTSAERNPGADTEERIGAIIQEGFNEAARSIYLEFQEQFDKFSSGSWSLDHCNSMDWTVESDLQPYESIQVQPDHLIEAFGNRLKMDYEYFSDFTDDEEKREERNAAMQSMRDKIAKWRSAVEQIDEALLAVINGEYDKDDD